MSQNYLDVTSAYIFGSFVQNTLVMSGLIMGRVLNVLPRNKRDIIFFTIGLVGISHASSNVLSIFSNNLVGGVVTIWDSSGHVKSSHSAVGLFGGHTWVISGILTDFCMAVMAMKKTIFVLSHNGLINYNAKTHWYAPYLTGFLTFPG